MERILIGGTAAIAVPLLVTIVVCIVARREGTAVPRAALLPLSIATIASVLVLFWFPYLITALLLTAVLFCVFAIPVMSGIERSARADLPADPVRSASIVPRRIGMYVSLAARAANIVTALALLCWVVLLAIDSRRLFMAVTHTFAGITFFALYQAWMQQEVFEVRAASEDDRRRRVRAIFAAQVILTLSFLLIAALSLGTWPGVIPLTVAAAIIGVPGCAFALSTGIQKRFLEAWQATRE